MEFKFKVGVEIECTTFTPPLPPPPLPGAVPPPPPSCTPPPAIAPREHPRALEAPDRERTALKRGEIIAGTIVVVICGAQMLPGVWKAIESSPVAKFLSKQVFKPQLQHQTKPNSKSNSNQQFVKFPKGSVLAASPKKGETVSSYSVASPFGWRKKPCAVCSNYHNGVDVGAPKGTSLYAIALPGHAINVACYNTQLGGLTAVIKSESIPDRTFAAVHLSSCFSGTHKAGKIFALTGNSGQATTGPHLHWVEKVNGEAVPPQRGYVEWAITGSVPNLTPPTPAQKKTSKYGHFAYAEAPQWDLVEVGNRQKLRRAAATAFKQMVAAAARQGIAIAPLSGFRDKYTQHELFYGVAAKRGQSWQERAKVSAPPGYSEHHTGYAIDIGDGNAPEHNLKQSFERSRAFYWLAKHAKEFDFEMSFSKNNPQGVSYEPWHWRFVGSPESQKLFK